MARYTTTIRTTLAPSEAFAYMADFSNARFWDPSVSAARREGEGPVGSGSRFHLVARFAGRESIPAVPSFQSPSTNCQDSRFDPFLPYCPISAIISS